MLAISPNRLQLLLGAGFLLLGVAVYVLARPAAIWILPAALHFPSDVPWLVRASGAVPTFTHTAAFALLTAGVLGDTRRTWAACCTWVAINAAFEIGQHPAVSRQLAQWLPRWLDHVWLLDQTRAYFVNGTFDSTDIAAAALGGAAAWAVIRMTRSRGSQR